MSAASSLAWRNFLDNRIYLIGSPLYHWRSKSIRSSSTNPLRLSYKILISLHCKHLKSHTSQIRVLSFDSIHQGGRKDINNRNLDAFLPIAESFCLVFSSIVLLCLIFKCIVSRWRTGLACLPMDGYLVWVFAGFLGALTAGALMRKIQWSRFVSDQPSNGFPHVNLVDRVDKLDDSIRNSTTLVKMLSRQLEKLGVRFRVSRKAMRRPMDEIAALEQKNSEAVRTLALKTRTLEEELREIQKVLLAMQEQQKKQLELILAIGKNGRAGSNNV